LAGKIFLFSDLALLSSQFAYTALLLKAVAPIEGNLLKRGGKGHKFQNWKKRHFVLKGNTLLYYEKAANEAKEIQGLKGWVDLTEITQLVKTEDPADGCDKPHYIKIVVNNDKEYFLAASSAEEKAKWFKAIRKQMRFLSEEFQLIGLDLKDYEEVPVRTGAMTRRTNFGLEKFFFVLTTLNIRIYKTDKVLICASFEAALLIRRSLRFLSAGLRSLRFWKAFDRRHSTAWSSRTRDS
jgi:hypothetical protein